MDLPLRNTDPLGAFVPTEANLQLIINRSKVCNLLACILCGSTSFTDNEKDTYIHKVLQLDIMEQTSCSDEIKLYRFLCTTASMIGTIVNYTALANAVGVSAPTARQWLRFLEGAGILYLLEPMERVSGKRLVKAHKLYFRDTGIAAYLLQIHDTVTLLRSVYYKRLFENYVVNALRESYLSLGLEPDWYFYRDSNAKDISLVLYDGRCVYPIIIDKDGLSLNKLAKSFVIIKEFAAEKQLEYGNGCQITSVGGSQRLAQDLYQIDAALL
ncbi:MAG: ATP-binding protein [Phascolarctobacterium sp.]